MIKKFKNIIFLISFIIFTFLTINYYFSEGNMIHINKSKSHIIKGNRMRHQSEKNNKIIYDNRWFDDNKWLVPFILFRRIRNYNKKILLNNFDSSFDL